MNQIEGHHKNFFLLGKQCERSPPGGGGGTPLYKPYRHVPPQRVGLLGLFGLKTGIDFAHFGLESGYGFRGNYRSV